MSEEENTTFSQEQADYLSSLHFINHIDGHLRIVANVRVVQALGPAPARVVLLLEILYDNARIDSLSFDLHNYRYEEIIEIARNIRGNDYILQEVDNALAGGIE